tara:strand:- start:568 stop:858 length:291 start_codon:yes stop_codon:yes gene_type:complete
MTGKDAWKLIHWIEERAIDNPDMVRLEPRENFDHCIAGVVTRINLNVLCYDTIEILLMLQKEMGMTADEAEEHYSYNIEGSYMGEHSPVFLNAVAF